MSRHPHRPVPRLRVAPGLVLAAAIGLATAVPASAQPSRPGAGPGGGPGLGGRHPGLARHDGRRDGRRFRGELAFGYGGFGFGGFGYGGVLPYGSGLIPGGYGSAAPFGPPPGPGPSLPPAPEAIPTYNGILNQPQGRPVIYVLNEAGDRAARRAPRAAWGDGPTGGRARILARGADDAWLDADAGSSQAGAARVVAVTVPPSPPRRPAR